MLLHNSAPFHGALVIYNGAPSTGALGITVITPFNRSFIKVPVIASLVGFPVYIAAGTGVNAVFKLAKGKPRWFFTKKAFDSIAFEEAYPPGTVGRNIAVRTKSRSQIAARVAPTCAKLIMKKSVMWQHMAISWCK